MRNYLYVCVFLTFASFDCYSQEHWVKVNRLDVQAAVTLSPGNASRVSRSLDRGDDPTYNFGSAELPSPRTDMIFWPDSKGGVWMYGGIGYGENKQWGMFSDLWKYDPAIDKWSLIFGEGNKANVEDKEITNLPLYRKEACAWIDNDGKLWLFGGRQFSDLRHLDDLWVFDPKSRSWAKVSGKSKFNEKPTRGAIKGSSKQYSPGARSLASGWTDRKGNLWLFGGLSYSANQTVIAELYSDLWMFDTKKKEWQWVSGKDKPNQPHKYEVKNELSKENVPSPRAAAAHWYDTERESLFIYGGVGFDSSATSTGGLSDMWAYNTKKDEWRRLSGDSKLSAKYKVEDYFRGSVRNAPGYRISPLYWKGSDGALYMAGGQNSFKSELIDIEPNLWAFEPKSGEWRVIPQHEITIIGSGASFNDGNGILYMFGGKEFDRQTLRTRPSNQMYKLTN